MRWLSTTITLLCLALSLAIFAVGCTPAGNKADPAPTAAAQSSAASKPTVATPPEAAPAAPIKALDPSKGLRVGVTLHPYFSWAKNVVGDRPASRSARCLPGEIDAGNYQPRPEDIKKLPDLDALVINGIGHDDFIHEMVKASGNTRSR
jgi:ABC-type Zn uptake system ZnuABC Zn-binding protein ZnuA